MGVSVRMKWFYFCIYLEHCLEQSLCCFELATFLSLCAGFRHLAPHKYTYTKACYLLLWKSRMKAIPEKLVEHIHLHFLLMECPAHYRNIALCISLANQSESWLLLSSRSGMERMFEVFSFNFPHLWEEYDWVHVLWKIEGVGLIIALFQQKANTQVWRIYFIVIYLFPFVATLERYIQKFVDECSNRESQWNNMFLPCASLKLS